MRNWLRNECKEIFVIGSNLRNQTYLNVG